MFNSIYNLILLCVKSFLGRAFNLLRPVLRLLRLAAPVGSPLLNGMRWPVAPAYLFFLDKPRGRKTKGRRCHLLMRSGQRRTIPYNSLLRGKALRALPRKSTVVYYR